MELINIAVIVVFAVPAPLFIVLQFINKWKQSREISGGDEQMLEDMWLWLVAWKSDSNSSRKYWTATCRTGGEKYEQRRLESESRPIARAIP